MDLYLKRPFSLIATILVLLLPCPIRTSLENYNHTTLVFNRCADQTYTGSPDSHSQTLSTLFQQLLTQSFHSKFSKATVGDINLGISGLYQCRGNLGNEACHRCVNTLPQALNNLCKDAVAARVQLSGCYVHYETDGFVDDSPDKHELLHKKCSNKKAVEVGFQEARNAAFAAMESEIVSDNGFYYDQDYDYVHIVAQCEGDLLACDCSECLNVAVQIAEEQCGDSISGEVYLDMCSLSYTNGPGGIAGGYPGDEGSRGNNSGKMVAIVLGGGTALLGGFILFKFLKSCGRKDDI